MNCIGASRGIGYGARGATSTNVLVLTCALFLAAVASPAEFAVGDIPVSVTVCDLNGDGVPDLVTTNAGSNNVTVLLGDGAGGFAAAPGSPFAAGLCPQGVATGDFDGDGKLDLVIGASGSVILLLGDGAGGFTPSVSSPIAVEAYRIVVGDFNGDGKLDFAGTSGAVGGSVGVMLGTGDGNFAPAAGSPFAAGNQCLSIATADVNGDGRLDVVTANAGSDNVSVLLGNGSGGFVPATGSPFAAGSNPSCVAIADVNGDGKPDLVTANNVSQDITVLLGDGTGAFAPSPASPIGVSNCIMPVAVGDFNNDGKVDLVATGGFSQAWVLLGDGTGGFSLAAGAPFDLGDVGVDIVDVAVADFNGDGKLDLVSANQDTDNVSVLVNQPPSATNLTPPSVVAGTSGFALTVDGSVFVNGSVVRLDGADRDTTFVSSSQLRADIPAADTRTGRLYSVTVRNPGFAVPQTSNSVTLTVNNPVPAIVSLSPAATLAGNSGGDLTITGANFSPVSIVRWNGSDRTTTYLGSTLLSAQITDADVAATGTASITVFNPLPAGGASNTSIFAIYSTPAIASLSPSSAGAGTGPLTLEVSGSQFVDGSSAVQVNGEDRPTGFVSSDRLTTELTRDDLRFGRIHSITVANAGFFTRTVSNSVTFTVINPVPAITSLSPTIAFAGGFGGEMIVNGAGFVDPVSVVRWNGVDCATTFVSATQLRILVPASSVATAGTATVTVFNPTPAGGESGGATFTIVRAEKDVPVIIWPTPTDITYGTALGPAQLNATADTAGVFTYFPPLGTVLAAGSSQVLFVLFAPTDTASYAMASATVSINVIPAPPPIIASAPTPSPAAPMAGDSVQFSCAATDSLTVTYAWDFGDGTTGSGASVTHVFSPAGTYTVRVTATNTAGLSSSQTLTLTVAPAGGTIAGDTDADGDGISDALEALAGTDPNNASDAPVKEGAVVADKLSVGLSFTSAKDSIKATLRLILPAGYTNSGATVGVQIADHVESFTGLDAKGSSPKGLATLKVQGASATAGPATGGLLTLSVSKKDLDADLASAGMTNRTTTGKSGEPLAVPVAVALTTADGKKYVYIGSVNVVYKATQGKSGKAAKAK